MRLPNSLCALLGLALLLASALPAEARRVYAGEEAQALKCAWIISATATALEQAEVISTRDMEVSIAVSARMLQLYVSGTERQKLAALEAVGDRRDIKTTLGEFQRESRACLRKFPV
ncbi:MAG: hypothetical protein QNJ09_05285 [Paracoccaceae bacterium]|nr:hypothetical protein [Paracoccaceae bacterium]